MDWKRATVVLVDTDVSQFNLKIFVVTVQIRFKLIAKHAMKAYEGVGVKIKFHY